MSEENEASDSETSPAVSRIDRRLLEVLVCPLTKSALVYDEARQELISRKAGVAYPIRNGVPLLTAEAARQLSDAEIDTR